MDITNCDREAIHVPGSIQPHGLLIVFDPASERVIAAAGDVERFLGISGPLLGREAREVLGESLGRLASAPLTEGKPIYLKQAPGTDLQALDLLAHNRGDLIIVEVEPASDANQVAVEFLAKISEHSTAIVQTQSSQEACQLAAAIFAEISGYERAMVYQFLEDGSGKVVAEQISGNLPSYLNQHFPESDIPKQARTLYTRNLIRVIPDVNYVPAPILPQEIASEIDLSDCSLRSVSPIHVQYLKNMEVGASMSVSVLCQGRLWGLIACHNSTPRRVSFQAREACKQLGILLGLHVHNLAAALSAEDAGTLTSESHALLMSLSRADDPEAELELRSSELISLFPSTGLILRRGTKLQRWGKAPPPSDCLIFTDWVQERTQGDIYASSHVSAEHAWATAHAKSMSGALAIRLEVEDPLVIVWAREEYAQTIEWAGIPLKKNEDTMAELTPRKSFAGWKEQVRGRSLPWAKGDVVAAARLKERLERIFIRHDLHSLQSELIFVSRLSAMGAMASTLAHELNQPLAVISNYAAGLLKMLRGGRSDPVLLTSGLEELEKSALRGGLIIRRLREMIRRSTVTREPLDVTKVVRAAIGLAKRSMGVVEIKCEFNHTLEVHADPVQIQHVFLSLLKNAAEASHATGSKTVLLSTADRHEFVEFTVEDRGEGIAHDAIPHLFDAFSSQKSNGLGIGLSICRTIVEAHGGTIHGDNRTEGGARFSFSLPRSSLEIRPADEVGPSIF